MAVTFFSIGIICIALLSIVIILVWFKSQKLMNEIAEEKREKRSQNYRIDTDQELAQVPGRGSIDGRPSDLSRMSV